jgi:hypothetical protein
VLDRDVLALDVARLLEPLAKSAQWLAERFRGLAVEEPDDSTGMAADSARAAIGQTTAGAAALPSSVMNSRRLIQLPRRRSPKVPSEHCSPGLWPF